MALTDATVARMLARFGVMGGDTPVAVAGGHINDSFLVRGRGPLGPGRFLLQRLNPAVFPAGAAVVANAAQVAAYLAGAAADRGWSAQQWRVARPLAAEDGVAGAQDETGAWWRVFPYLEGTRTIDRARAPAEAHEIGRAFGVFHDLMAGYDGPSLVETLPGFHDTPARLARLEVVAEAASPALGREAGAQLAFALDQRAWAGLLAGRDLPRRVVHNDAKAANVLLDAATGLAVTVVDLDTVMHGTLLHDIGDLIRSTVGTAAEDAEAGTAVVSDRGLFGALMGGFVRGLGALGARAVGVGAGRAGRAGHHLRAGHPLSHRLPRRRSLLPGYPCRAEPGPGPGAVPAWLPRSPRMRRALEGIVAAARRSAC